MYSYAFRSRLVLREKPHGFASEFQQKLYKNQGWTISRVLHKGIQTNVGMRDRFYKTFVK
jgi:hypothetical protein